MSKLLLLYLLHFFVSKLFDITFTTQLNSTYMGIFEKNKAKLPVSDLIYGPNFLLRQPIITNLPQLFPERPVEDATDLPC